MTQKTPREFLFPGFVLSALCLSFLLPSPGVAGLAEKGSKVAILDFFNLTGEEEYDEWEALFGRGLRRALFTDERVEIIRFPLIHSAIEDLQIDPHYITPDQSLPIAQKVSADLLVLGSFNVVGGVIASSLKIVDGKTGNLLQDDTRFGYEDQVNEFLKDLEEGLKTVLFSGQEAVGEITDPTLRVEKPSGVSGDSPEVLAEPEAEESLPAQEPSQPPASEKQAHPSEQESTPVGGTLLEQAQTDLSSSPPQVEFEGPGAGILPAEESPAPVVEEPAESPAAKAESPPAQTSPLEPSAPSVESSMADLEKAVGGMESTVQDLTEQVQETVRKEAASGEILGGSILGAPVVPPITEVPTPVPPITEVPAPVPPFTEVPAPVQEPEAAETALEVPSEPTPEPPSKSVDLPGFVPEPPAQPQVAAPVPEAPAEPALEPVQPEEKAVQPPRDIPSTHIGPPSVTVPKQPAETNVSPWAAKDAESGMVFVEELHGTPPLVEGPVDAAPAPSSPSSPLSESRNDYEPVGAVDPSSPWGSVPGNGVQPPAPSSDAPKVQNVLDQAWNRVQTQGGGATSGTSGPSGPQHLGRSYTLPGSTSTGQPQAPVAAPPAQWNQPPGQQPFAPLPPVPSAGAPSSQSSLLDPWQPAGPGGVTQPQPQPQTPGYGGPPQPLSANPIQAELPRLQTSPMAPGRPPQSPFQPQPAQPMAPPPPIPGAVPNQFQTLVPEPQALPGEVDQPGPIRRFGRWVGRSLGFGQEQPPVLQPPVEPTLNEPPRQQPDRGKFLWIFDRKQSNAAPRPPAGSLDTQVSDPSQTGVWVANAMPVDSGYATDVPFQTGSRSPVSSPESSFSAEPLFLRAMPLGNLPRLSDSPATEPFPGPATLAELGQSYFASGNYDLAEDTFRKAVAQEPRNADLRYNLSQVYLATRQDDKAVAELEKVKELNPQDAEALDRLSALYAHKGDWGKTVDTLTQKALAAPTDAKTFVRLGMAFDQAGNPKQAVRAYKKALSLDPKDAKAARNIASVYLKLDEKELAEPYIQMARTLDAGDPHLDRFQWLANLPGPSKEATRGTLFTKVDSPN